jgi:hypothetical protein
VQRWHAKERFFHLPPAAAAVFAVYQGVCEKG